MRWKFWKKDNEEKPKKRKSVAREWTDAILFAVIAASIIRWGVLQLFTIPTASMENSLLVGDFLFVSKMHYGPITPKTPLQVPLTHQKVPFFNVKSYLDWIELPQYRLPGFTHIKRNDVVVFNYPEEFQHPTDLKTNYIKRCIGAPGDTLEVRDTQVYINGEKGINPPEMEYSYYVKTRNAVNPRVFKKCNIWDYVTTNDGYYVIGATPESAKKLANYPFIDEVILDKSKSDEIEANTYPKSDLFEWNKDFYGPVTIPAEGMTIELTEENVAMYIHVIEHFEGYEKVVLKEGKLIVDGEAISEYTFKQNYYFMMGDNRHNSLDSRYWGFVPEDHVVGKALFVLISLDQHESFPDKIRWNRIFMGIK